MDYNEMMIQMGYLLMEEDIRGQSLLDWKRFPEAKRRAGIRWAESLLIANLPVEKCRKLVKVADDLAVTGTALDTIAVAAQPSYLYEVLEIYQASKSIYLKNLNNVPHHRTRFLTYRNYGFYWYFNDAGAIMIKRDSAYWTDAEIKESGGTKKPSMLYKLQPNSMQGNGNFREGNIVISSNAAFTVGKTVIGGNSGTTGVITALVSTTTLTLREVSGLFDTTATVDSITEIAGPGVDAIVATTGDQCAYNSCLFEGFEMIIAKGAAGYVLSMEDTSKDIGKALMEEFYIEAGIVYKGAESK